MALATMPPRYIRRMSTMNNFEGLFDISGRTALITGGSRGIGEMIVRGYAAAGARVYLAARNVDAAAALAADVPNATALPADLSTLEGVEALAGALAEQESSLDILVNNAGATWGEPLETFSEEGWDKVLDLNVKGLFFLTKSVHGLLVAAATADRPSRVINIASIDGIRVTAFESYSYAASKAAVIHLTKVLARRLGQDNINVNAIAPGLFPSKMTKFILDNFEEQLLAEIPQGRPGNPGDMAGTAIYLASAASNYMTGQTLVIDGGITGTA